MKRVNTFVAMGSEVQEKKEKKEEGIEETTKGSRKKMLGRKRAGKEQQKDSLKKQKLEEEKEGPSENFSKRQGIWTWNALKWRVRGSLRRNIPEGLRRNILQRRNESSHPLWRKASPTLRRNI
ncbi:hypothetical protein Tco_1364724 [Tanacetum coccineum]